MQDIEAVAPGIDECEVLYLESVAYDFNERQLTAHVAEGVLASESESVDVGDQVLEATPFVIGPTSRKFLIVFPKVAAHFIVDSFYRNTVGPGDALLGRNLLLLNENKFVSFVSDATIFESVVDADARFHYGLLTSDAEVFVASSQPVFVLEETDATGAAAQAESAETSPDH